MGQWTRAELLSAFEHYAAEVEIAAATGEWDRFADCFTEDSTYDEHVYGSWRGRETTRAWIHRTMTSFPGSMMAGFPAAWVTVDEERGWVICEIRNLMRDPGDGSMHEASNITILRYAGNGLFGNEEDIYNPERFLTMVQDWCRVAEKHGNLPDEGRAWLTAFD
jgi:hypothetical protein